MGYRWGIIGTGHIAHQFAKGLKICSSSECYAVASRGMGKAKKFAAEEAFTKAYGSYEELFKDPLVDIVYIATPNHLHYSLTMEALENGKNVLCEKPFASNLRRKSSTYPHCASTIRIFSCFIKKNSYFLKFFDIFLFVIRITKTLLLLYMNIKFMGDVDQFTRDFLREQYNQHPDLLKQEMLMTANILAATNKRREDKEHLDGLDAM